MRTPVTRSLYLGVLAALFQVGCGSSSRSDLDTDLVRSSLSRDTSPELGNDALTHLAADNTTFAFALYHDLPGGTNLVYSPYSVSISLAMLSAGAVGTTADGIRTALDFMLSPEALHPAFDSLDLALSSRTGAGNAGQPFQLTVANSLWGDLALVFKPPFLDTLATDYGTGVHAVDFQHATETARDRINGWVSEKTRSKIQDLIPPNGVGPDTRLALVNAIYFNAGWNTNFDTAATQPGPFHLLDGTTITSQMMHSHEYPGSYAKGTNYQAAELPYKGDESLLVVVPDDGAFEAVEGGLGQDFVASVVSGLAATTLDVTLPRFTVTGATIDLREELTKLGMSVAFGGDADFSAMTTTPIHVQDVFHQAYIEVDESGTVAAAATAITGTKSAGIASGLAFTVDRPFFYAIRDVPTNTLLFVGREVNPT